MTNFKKDKTLVVGASEKTDRYANIAVRKLRQFNHRVIALGNKVGKILDTPIIKERKSFRTVDTVTLYINKTIQKEYYVYLLSLKPRRIIFNPGTENPEFYAILKENNISYEEACTLVLLNTGQY